MELWEDNNWTTTSRFLTLFSYNCKEKSPSNGLLTHLKITRNTGDRGRTDTSSTDTGF